MRPRVPVLLCALGVLATAAPGVGPSAGADDDLTVAPAPTPSADELVLVARGASLVVRTAEAPALTDQLARVVLADLDHARGQGARVSLVGDGPDLPPAGWPLALAGGVAGPVPAAPADGQRRAALWALAGFVLDEPATTLRVLELRARYRDGIAIWLNGVPVARRGLAPGGHPLRLAERPHGPEWETFFVPVTPGLLRAGDNVVAVEVHPGEHSRAPALELEIVARRASKIVRGPIVQHVGPTAAGVVVETDLPARVTLAWGPTAALGTMVSAPLGQRHQFALPGLAAATRIHYQLTVDGVPGPVHRFATAPAAGEVLRVAVYGDVRGGHAIHARLIAAIQGESPDLVVASGDLVLRGNDEADWQRFFAVAGPLLAAVPYYSVLGNHDVGRAGDLGRRMNELFGFPAPPPDRPAAGWYSFAVAGVHFVMLDSNAYDDPAQQRWLEADLAAARRAGARTILAFTHDGPFARGTHGGNQVAARQYAPILVRAGVTLLFSGHDHLYQRGRQDGLDYIVSGGGGASLYPITCGIAGRPACRHADGMRHVAREHHYVMLAVYPTFVQVCAMRPDGTPLEPCVTY